MSQNVVCDRCNSIEQREAEKMYELTVELVDPSVTDGGDNVLFWANIDVCDRCLPVVDELLKSRLITTKTPIDSWGVADRAGRKHPIVGPTEIYGGSLPVVADTVPFEDGDGDDEV